MTRNSELPDPGRRPRLNRSQSSRRITRRERNDATIAPVQRGIWVSSRQGLDDDPYLVFDFSRVHGALDVEVLRECLASLGYRHEALRIAFTDEETPVQVVSDTVSPDLEFLDLSGHPDAEAEAMRLVEEQTERPLDLTKAPLWRAMVIRLGPAEHMLLLTIHHLICDEWSLNLIHRDLDAAYAARIGGLPSPLAQRELGYGDFAEWQASRHSSAVGDRSLEHWRKAMRDIPHELHVPADYNGAGSVTYKGHKVRWALTSEESDRFGELARRFGASPFILMVTLFGVVLARHSGQPDLAVGTAMAGRPSLEAEQMVGQFVNLLPVPVRLRDEPSLAEAVERTKREFLGLLDHQDVAFDRLVSALGAGRSDLRMPLCQANVSWSESEDTSWSLGRTRIEPVARPYGSAKSELSLAGARSRGGFEFELIGEMSFFKPDTLRLIMDHFRGLVASASCEPDRPVGDLDLAYGGERRRLSQWSGSASHEESRNTIPRLFAEAVDHHRDSVAVVGVDKTLTYAELDARSEAWASRLRRLGVSTDAVVGVAVPRSTETVAAILGILKTGGAYLALSNDGPAAYNAFCVADSKATAVVATANTTGVLGDIGCQVVLSEEVDAADEPALPPDERCTPDSLAYVSYTSGSTGTPKRVGITHQNIVRVAYRSQRIAHGPGKTFVQLASLGFDISAIELWACLLHGGRLVAPRHGRFDIPELASILRDDAVSTFVTTTALFTQLIEQRIDALGGVEQILIGGETAAATAFNKAIDADVTRDVELLHCYGPTENTCVTTSAVIGDNVDAAVPIGTPIEGSTVYVLNPSLERVPVGVTGELYTGGVGVSRGYLNDAGLTASRFLPDLYSDVPGSRMYRTGDAARWTVDGELEFVERMDRQVKVRGFRIEPGEIEAKLMEHQDVCGAVVVVRTGPGGHKQLVGYVVPAVDAVNEPTRLRSFIAMSLPEHMVPGIITNIERIPMTPNGKVDRDALPSPVDDADAAKRRPASTPTENLLSEIWKSVLVLDDIGVDVNFFELGGDSILSIRVAARAREAGMRLSSTDVFAYPVIAELGAVIDGRSAGPAENPIDPVPGGQATLAPIQRWFVEQYGAENHFNQSMRWRSGEALDETLLQDAFEAVVRHHDSLRLRLSYVDGQWTQTSTAAAARDYVTVMDFQGALHEREKMIERESAALQRSLDVGDGTLIRALLVTDEAGQDDLVIIAHHLAVDTVSWEVLARHLENAYRRLKSGKTPTLPVETISFIDWSAALARSATTNDLAMTAGRWREIDERRSSPRDDNGRVGRHGDVRTELDPVTTARLLRRPIAVCKVDIKSVLLTALARTLSEWTGGDQWVIDMEEHGRDALGPNIDLSESVGWFTALFPVGLTIDMNDTTFEQLSSIHTQLCDQPPGYTYGVMRYLRSDGGTEAVIRSDMSFNYHGRVVGRSETGLLRRVGGGVGGDINGDLQRPNRIELNSLVADGSLLVRLSYPSESFSEDEMQDVVDRFGNHCRTIADAF